MCTNSKTTLRSGSQRLQQKNKTVLQKLFVTNKSDVSFICFGKFEGEKAKRAQTEQAKQWQHSIRDPHYSQ